MPHTAVKLETLKVGYLLPTLSFGPVTSEHLVRWVAASEDFHAIHYDKDFAIEQGLPGVVMQGPFKLALIERQLLDLFGEKGELMSLSCTYRATDVIGDTLIFQPKVTATELAGGTYRISLEIAAKNQKGVTTVEGKAVVAVRK